MSFFNFIFRKFFNAIQAPTLSDQENLQSLIEKFSQIYCEDNPEIKFKSGNFNMYNGIKIFLLLNFKKFVIFSYPFDFENNSKIKEYNKKITNLYYVHNCFV